MKWSEEDRQWERKKKRDSERKKNIDSEKGRIKETLREKINQTETVTDKGNEYQTSPFL